MKLTKFTVLLFTLSILFNCSSSDSDQDSNISNPGVIEKDLLKVTEDEGRVISYEYENGKINKVWSLLFQSRSQMTYNSNGTLSREYKEDIGTTDNENFEWEIPVSDNYIENIYENGKLTEILEHHSSGTTEKILEYKYQGDLVVEKRQYFYGRLHRIFSYIYNDQNELTTIIRNETPDGGDSHTLQVTFDDKVNPYFNIWNKTKLKFWFEPEGLARYNLEFYPHNILTLEEVGVSDSWYAYETFFTYDTDGYPIIMNITKGVLAGDNYYFEYN